MKRIGQICLVLIMLLAFIGINVQQLHCCHTEHVRWGICFLPSDVSSLSCEERCCGEQSCHHTTRSDFYKITDCSQIESESDLSLWPILSPEGRRCEFEVEKLITFEYQLLEDKWPDRGFLRPLLCIYQC